MHYLSVAVGYLWFYARIASWVISGMIVLALILQVVVGPFIDKIILGITDSVSRSACNVIRFYYTERYEFVKRCAADEDH